MLFLDIWVLHLVQSFLLNLKIEYFLLITKNKNTKTTPEKSRVCKLVSLSTTGFLFSKLDKIHDIYNEMFTSINDKIKIND